MREYDKETDIYSTSNEYNKDIKRKYKPLEETEEIKKDFKSNYEPLDENEEFINKLENDYEPLTEPENPKYSTVEFIKEILNEISKMVPVRELHGGRISYDKLSEYLGMHKRYIRDTVSRMKNSKSPKYNPDFRFSKDQLEHFLNSLSQNLHEQRISKFVEIFSKYNAMNDLPEYRQQQWDLHNPNLKIDFFKFLDNPEKGYYFGLLLADGTNEKEKIGLFLEKKDIGVINRFREVLGISNKVEHRIDRRKRKKSGEYPERFGVRVGCIPMVNDLKELGFFDFKNGKALRSGFFTSLEHEVALSVLLGFYDGDGEEGAPIIHSTNKQFLQQVKKEFNVSYGIKLKRKGGKQFVWIGESETKPQWYLRFGPRLFNQAMKTYTHSMKRKRKYFPMRTDRQAYEILSQYINSKEKLEELILIGPRIHLAENLGCSFNLFKKICDEYGVKTLPHSYWKKTENKNWKLAFEKKINKFKKRYFEEG